MWQINAGTIYIYIIWFKKIYSWFFPTLIYIWHISIIILFVQWALFNKLHGKTQADVSSVLMKKEYKFCIPTTTNNYINLLCSLFRCAYVNIFLTFMLLSPRTSSPMNVLWNTRRHPDAMQCANSCSVGISNSVNFQVCNFIFRPKRTLNSKKYGVDLISYTHAINTAVHSSTKVDGKFGNDLRLLHGQAEFAISLKMLCVSNFWSISLFFRYNSISVSAWQQVHQVLPRSY